MASMSISMLSAAAPPLSSSLFRSPIMVMRMRTWMPSLSSCPSSSVMAFSSRRRNKTITTKKKKSREHQEKEKEEDDDIDEDAIEALFTQLEEDLKNDQLLDDDEDDEITEEDLARLEQELEEAFGDNNFAEASDDSPATSDNLDIDDESDEEERPPVLKNWQLRRLARALKIGRRKTSIKSLSAELGLDRAVVLEVLREPPPELLLLSASLPDEIPQTSQSESKPLENEEALTPDADIESSEPSDVTASDAESTPDTKLPVHVMRTKWAGQKRLKKVQLETLERVYSRTKRPTNAMISSVVHVTNLPWKTVVKWFEDKRTEDGVPDARVPYRPALSVD